MNAFEGLPGGGGEPRITLISVERVTYYLYEGEDFLNQLLLSDGVYPRPVRCVHFATVFEQKRFLGEGVNLAHLWGINPEIVERLRRDEHLLEFDAPLD
ncbi:MAG: hypothetical protein WBN04_01530 [Paracoccaceae bacterium]